MLRRPFPTCKETRKCSRCRLLVSLCVYGRSCVCVCVRAVQITFDFSIMASFCQWSASLSHTHILCISLSICRFSFLMHSVNTMERMWCCNWQEKISFLNTDAVLFAYFIICETRTEGKRKQLDFPLRNFPRYIRYIVFVHIVSPTPCEDWIAHFMYIEIHYICSVHTGCEWMLLCVSYFMNSERRMAYIVYFQPLFCLCHYCCCCCCCNTSIVFKRRRRKKN